MTPQIADPSAGPSALEGNASGGGAPAAGPGAGGDGARAQVMGAIRELGKQVDDLGKQLPAASAEIGQMRNLLRKIILKAGGPTQNDSASKLPTGGSQ